MELFFGMVLGWITAPYVLVALLLFFGGFPIFFLGYDIYDDDGYGTSTSWNYNFLRTAGYIALSLTVLNFFTPFKFNWLITGDFWTSALNLWLYVVAYVAVGLVFAYMRFFFYAREYRKRMDDRIALAADKKAAQDREYKNRLSGYGSRVSLILKWIFHWPWSVLAWVFTDLVRDLCKNIVDLGRAIFGGAFGNIARSTEPEWMKEREAAENAAKAARKSSRGQS